GGRLSVQRREGRWVAGCPHHPEHTALRSYAQEHRDDVQRRMEADPRLAQSLAQHNALVPLTTRAIQELDNEKLLARIPARYGNTIEVTQPQRIQLAQLARVYGLDPLHDLMIYEGRPYVTYDGRLRKLREATGYRGHTIR